MTHAEGRPRGSVAISPEALAHLGAPKLVYIREVSAHDIIAEASLQLPFTPAPDAIWYAVHAADGARLAILDDRDAAYAAARQHELTPVSVH